MSKLLGKRATSEQVKVYIDLCVKARNDKNDTGANGKMADVMCRAYVNKRLRDTDIKCRKSTEDDCKFKGSDGKYHTIEFKTGCGALAYEYELEYIENELLLQDVEYIAYNPELCHTMPIEKQFFVMTREQFLSILLDYSETKPHTLMKINKSRRQVNIQSFTNSTKKYEYLMENLFEYPTLEQFIEQEK